MDRRQTARLFYDDEHDALAQMLANSGKQTKELATYLWPGMKADSAYAKLKACITGAEHFKFHEIVAAMNFCGQFDPLFYACDETLHNRPDRKAPEDQEARVVETISRASETMERALAALDRLRSDRSKLARIA